MLYQALFVPPGQDAFPRTILEQAEISQYIHEFGRRAGDVAIVAVDEHRLAGAIWARRFPSSAQGYGFIDDQTPEISMAVMKDYRKQGIGTELLLQIEISCGSMGATALSLSVDRRNPAMGLYLRSGFSVFEEKGTSVTMRKIINMLL